MMFKDRHDAGKKLATRLLHYKENDQAIVIGLPRGGVVVAYEVAKVLNLPLDIMCPRKIGAPFNPEFAIGAITETGEGIFDAEVISRLEIPQEYIDQTIEHEKQVAQMRLKIYRKNRPKISLEGKTVLLIDDGLATGATMRAAIKSARAKKVAKIVVAVPIAPPETLLLIQHEADEVICLDAPHYFAAVGQFYQIFDQTEDEEVISLLNSTT